MSDVEPPQHGTEIRLHAISDGTFVARPSYFGAASGARPDVFSQDGAVVLPIGCFVARTADRVVLVDAGLGPKRQQLPDGMELRGGRLLAGLAALGTARDAITDVVCTHLHSDHVGWVFDQEGQPFFAAAAIWFGADDWAHFIDGPGEMDAHIRAGFRRCEGSTRLRPVRQDTHIASGIRIVPTPGHTPGHLCIAIDSGEQRTLLLGDAVTHPVQLEEPGWHSLGDVDADMADRTRQHLWRQMEAPRVRGVGAHFPELGVGFVADGADRRWTT